MELNFPSLAALVVETAGANWPTSRKNALKVNFGIDVRQTACRFG
jgi:hypothetical protein